MSAKPIEPRRGACRDESSAYVLPLRAPAFVRTVLGLSSGILRWNFAPAILRPPVFPVAMAEKLLWRASVGQSS